jgi:hypothetical protein
MGEAAALRTKRRGKVRWSRPIEEAEEEVATLA